MSDLAIAENRIRKTASEFHDDFILYGTKYENFSCPFCEIGLVAKAIYINEPQGKSPHFAYFPGKPHIFGCDGYPLVDGKSTKSDSRKHKITIGKEHFHFPEKLVSRSSAKKSTSSDIKGDNYNSAEIVKKRREKVGKEVGRAKYTSSLIRSFAGSYKNIIRLCYKYAKEINLDDKQRKELIKNILSQAPIDLEGYQTSYQVAFKGTKFFSKYPKIWKGDGEVFVKEKLIYIKSLQDCEIHSEANIVTMPFYVSIQIPNNIADRPAFHRYTIDRLVKARESRQKIRWFVYGAAKIIDDKQFILLKIDNIDHVFIEKSKNQH